MGAPQRFATRRLQAEAVLEAVLADPDAIVAELVRRGVLVQIRPGEFARAYEPEAAGHGH